MPRDKRKVHRFPVAPDIKYGNLMVAKLTNKVMLDGKKALAQKIVYDALDSVKAETKKDPVEVFETALKNITPAIEVKARRIGGAAYQVPVEVKGQRKVHLTLKWLVDAARARKGMPMQERLAKELIDAAAGQGAAVKKREDAHRMAEANKAMAHLARF